MIPIEKVRQLLEGKSCSRCGSTDRLLFHHIDPSTRLFTMSHCPAYAFEDELKKCIILCRSCHNFTHKDQGGIRKKPDYDAKWREANRDELNNYALHYYHQHKEEHREQVNERSKAHYYANKDAINQKRREIYARTR